MYTKILMWMVNRAFNRKNRKSIEPTIKALYKKISMNEDFKLENELFRSVIKESYRRIAQDNLKIRTEIVKVKKGSNRYDLAFFETSDGKQKVNLGRHWGREVNEYITIDLN